MYVQKNGRKLKVGGMAEEQQQQQHTFLHGPAVPGCKYSSRKKKKEVEAHVMRTLGQVEWIQFENANL